MNSALVERSPWRPIRERAAAVGRRLAIGVAVAFIASIVLGSAMAAGVSEVDGSGQTAVAMRDAASVLALAVLGALASWVMQPGVQPAARYLRVLWAQLRWVVPSLGFRLPIEHSRGRPRLMCSVVFVVAMAIVLARSPVWEWFAERASGPSGDAQLAANAERSLWFVSGWGNNVPGLILVSGVVSEEVIYRGLLLIIVCSCGAVLDRRRRSHRAVLALVSLVALTVSSIGFGLMHSDYSTLNVASMTVNGFVWGIAALWTRSLVPSIVGHTYWNLMSTGAL